MSSKMYLLIVIDVLVGVVVAGDVQVVLLTVGVDLAKRDLDAGRESERRVKERHTVHILDAFGGAGLVRGLDRFARQQETVARRVRILGQVEKDFAVSLRGHTHFHRSFMFLLDLLVLFLFLLPD